MEAKDPAERTVSVVGKFKWGDAILNVDVKYIVVFLALVKLFSARAHRVHDLTDLLPTRGCRIPLSRFNSSSQQDIEVSANRVARKREW